MKKLSKVQVAELLGPAPISRVTDRELCSLISPQTRALLGPIESIHTDATLLESSTPLFPGDEVSNLNGHLLYGGQSGFVRFPYVVTIYKTTYGYLVIKRDQHKFKLLAYVGDIFKGKAELTFMAALRDRRYDGTLRGNDCSLLSFTYDDPCNRPLPQGVKSVEVSVYAFAPGSSISHACGDRELEAFVSNPFKFLDRPELFLKLFEQAWQSNRSPGQISAPIGDLARYVAPRFEVLARRRGYDFIEDAASHYHVVMYAFAMGYRCTYKDQADEVAQLRAGIEAIKKSGHALTRPQESWVCVLQSLPQELIPPHLYLGGVKWPQDNISQQNLWMNKPLTEAAAELIPAPLLREKNDLPPIITPSI